MLFEEHPQLKGMFRELLSPRAAASRPPTNGNKGKAHAKAKASVAGGSDGASGRPPKPAHGVHIRRPPVVRATQMTLHRLPEPAGSGRLASLPRKFAQQSRMIPTEPRRSSLRKSTVSLQSGLVSTPLLSAAFEQERSARACCTVLVRPLLAADVKSVDARGGIGAVRGNGSGWGCQPEPRAAGWGWMARMARRRRARRPWRRRRRRS